MSFWAGVASGFKDAKAAKAEQDELEARRAERKEAFEYGVKRDGITDERAEAKRIEDLRQWNIQNDRAALIYEQGREDRLALQDQQQENLDRGFFADQKWKKSEWGMKVEKWDLTKLTAEQTKERADALFDNTLDMQQYGKLRDRAEDLRKNRAEARAIAETLRRIEITKFNQETADKNYAFREKQFVEQTRAAGVSEDLAKRGFDLKERAANLNYTKSIVEMIPASLAAALAGDDGKLVPIGSQTAVLGSKEFVMKYNTELSKQEQESPFFKAALRSPTAQTTLHAFIKAQVGKGNNIKMSELPEYFSYLGQVGGKGEKEALETVKNMLKGDGLDNPTDMAKGLLNLRVYAPTEELFEMTSVPKDATRDEKGFGIWKTATITEARLDMGKLPDGEKKTKVETAVAAVMTDKSNPIGYQMLAELGYGMNIQSDYNIAENPIVKSFYGEPVEEAEVIVPQEGGDDLPKLPADSSTVFSSFDEAKAAIDEGFTGKYSVGGKAYKTAEPEYPSNVPAGMLSNDAGEELDIEDALAADFGEGGNLKESGAIAKAFDQQAEGLSGMGTTEEQVEGSKPGQKEIDTETFVDRSFQGEGDEAMDLEGASAEIVSEKIYDVIDSLPPRTPKKNRVEWAMKEFKKRYTNALMPDDEIELRIRSLLTPDQ